MSYLIAAYAAVNAVLGALAAGTDTIIAGLVALFELELQIPVFSSLFESITGGQNLTLRNLASLITAPPTAVIGSALPSGSSMKRPTTTRRRELLTFESATPLLALPLALHSGELRAYAPDGTRVWSHR